MEGFVGGGGEVDRNPSPDNFREFGDGSSASFAAYSANPLMNFGNSRLSDVSSVRNLVVRLGILLVDGVLGDCEESMV
ncbi:hypothetical protein ACLOJK_021645 [Asimina triloba]